MSTEDKEVAKPERGASEIEQKIRLIGALKSGLYPELEDKPGTVKAIGAMIELEKSLPPELYKDILRNPANISREEGQILAALNQGMEKQLIEGDLGEVANLADLKKVIEAANVSQKFDEAVKQTTPLAQAAPDHGLGGNPAQGKAQSRA